MDYSFILHGVCAGLQHFGEDRYVKSRFDYFHQLSMEGATFSGDERPVNLFIVEENLANSICYYDILYLKGIRELSRGSSGARFGYIGLTLATSRYIANVSAVRSFLISVMENIVIPSVLTPLKQWKYDLKAPDAESFMEGFKDIMNKDCVLTILTAGEGSPLQTNSVGFSQEIRLNPEDVSNEDVASLLGNNFRVIISDSFEKRSVVSTIKRLNEEIKNLTEKNITYEKEVSDTESLNSSLSLENERLKEQATLLQSQLQRSTFKANDPRLNGHPQNGSGNINCFIEGKKQRNKREGIEDKKCSSFSCTIISYVFAFFLLVLLIMMFVVYGKILSVDKNIKISIKDNESTTKSVEINPNSELPISYVDVTPPVNPDRTENLDETAGNFSTISKDLQNGFR